MKKKIDIAGIDPILFVGLNDENIKLLEKSFNWDKQHDDLLTE